MKRILALLLGAAFIFGTAVQASAIEVQVSGEFDFVYGFTDNADFDKDDERDHFFARQRARIQAEFIASENLRGVLQMQFGDNTEWGDNSERSGGGLDTNSTSPYVRLAYIDWNVADTSLNVKMGLQYLAMPSAVFGNPFWGANMAGVFLGAGINDNVTLSAMWGRPWVNSGAHKNKYNQMDMFALVADFDYDQFAISPWVAYSRIGNNSGHWDGDYMTYGGAANYDWKNSDVFAGGIALSVSPIDDLEIKLDAMYAKLDNDGRKNGNLAPEGDGWLVALAVDYSMDWGTPGAFLWYASGDDKNDNAKGKFGRMPILAGDDGFVATRMGNPGAFSIGDDTFIGQSGVGTWGVGLQIAEMSFVEKLSHTARIAYFQGTNHKDAPKPDVTIGETVYLTTRDWGVEVNFDTEYQIYENFSAILELGYIYLDLDKKSPSYRGSKNEDENAWNAQLNFHYSF